MTIYDYAKLYTSFGWCIVPVDRLVGKMPSINGRRIEWTGYQKEKPTEAQLKEWFDGNDKIGIGVITGKISDLTVIDNDVYKPNAVGLALQTPIMAQSGAGGEHFFYKHNPNVSTYKNEEKCIDSRSEGGFIVLTPTVHPSTGKEYSWLTGLPTAEQLAKLAICPDEMENYRPTPKTETIDLTTLTNIEVGGRDQAIFDLACVLVYTNKPPEQILFVLQQVNKTFPQPLNERQVMEKLQSAMKYKEQSESDDHSYKGGSVLAVANFDPIWLKDMDNKLEEIDWLWEGFLAKGYLTLFSALWKSGKSTLISHLLKAMENENELAGMSVSKCKVLMVTEENKGIWVMRREDLGLTGDIAILSNPLIQRLKYKEWVEFLEKVTKFCMEQAIDVVIFDTIAAFWSVNNENDASEVGAAILPIKQLTEKNIAVMLIHHFRKSGGEEATASRGSGALGAAVDIIMDFNRMKGDSDNNKRVIKNYSRFKETPNEVVIELDGATYKTLGEKGEVKQGMKYQQISDVLWTIPEGATSIEIMDAWTDDDTIPKSERSLRRYLKQMLDKDVIEVVGTKIIKSNKMNVYKAKNSDGQTRHSPIEMATASEANNPATAKTDFINTTAEAFGIKEEQDELPF